jgi:hypothetical protein
LIKVSKVPSSGKQIRVSADVHVQDRAFVFNQVGFKYYADISHLRKICIKMEKKWRGKKRWRRGGASRGHEARGSQDEVGGRWRDQVVVEAAEEASGAGRVTRVTIGNIEQPAGFNHIVELPVSCNALPGLLSGAWI